MQDPGLTLLPFLPMHFRPSSRRLAVHPSRDASKAARAYDSGLWRLTLVPFSPMRPRSSSRSTANMPRREEVPIVDATPSEPRSLEAPRLETPSQLSWAARVRRASIRACGL